MNTDIYNDSDLWSSTITEQLLDRLVVEGQLLLLPLLPPQSPQVEIGRTSVRHRAVGVGGPSAELPLVGAGEGHASPAA